MYPMLHSLRERVVGPLIIMAFCSLPGIANSAKINIDHKGDIPVVTIEGTMNSDDGVQFANTVSGVRRALVVFSSPGGNLVAGLRIGDLIRLNRFGTYVPDGFACASACALAWLGGTPRFMGNNAHIGFHAAYTIENGRAKEAGAANAIVGAYLGRLGMSEDAIIYITYKAPEEMQWLGIRDARELGISVNVLGPHGTYSSDSVKPNIAKGTTREAPDENRTATRSPDEKTTTSKSPDEKIESLKEISKNFVISYFDHWAASNTDALAFFDRAYSNTIRAGDRRIAKSAVMNAKKIFAERYADRVYIVKINTLKTSCGEQSRVCTVSGEVEWRHGGGTDTQATSGTSAFTFELVIDNRRGAKITGEMSSEKISSLARAASLALMNASTSP